jgi:hypothetical protein
MKFAQRPWIGISVVDGIEVRSSDPKRAPWPTYVGNTATFELSFRLKNVGHSPAVVLVEAKATLDTDRWQKLQEEICDSARIAILKRGKEGWGARYTVFPGGEVFPYFLPVTLDVDKIRDTYTPKIVGCVMYAALDEVPRKTPFVGTMSVEDPKDQRPRGDITPIRLSDRTAPENCRLYVKDISIAGDAD